MKRSRSIDVLRGVAVVLMLVQHLGAWLWIAPLDDVARHLPEHAILLFLNGVGTLAAPIFVFLAGAGAWSLTRREGGGATAIERGIVLIVFGYALDLAAPRWFTPGSWYVLHMIGLAMILSPLLTRLSTRTLLLLSFAIVLISPVLQHALGTGIVLRNRALGDYHKPFGLLRLAIAEGHFPVFPWLAFFIQGVVAIRWTERKNWKALSRLTIACLALGSTLTAIGAVGFSWAEASAWRRFFTLRAGYYPGFPPLLFLVQGTTLLLFGAVSRLAPRVEGRAGDVLVCLGHASLTALFVHTLLFRTLSAELGLYKRWSEPTVLAVTLVVVATSAFLAVRWSRTDYKYGLEWLMRKLTARRAFGTPAGTIRSVQSR